MSLFKPPPGLSSCKAFTFPGLSPQAAPSSGTPAPFTFKPLDLGEPGSISYSAADLRHQAQQLVAEAQERCQDIERQAYEQGFLQGQKDGQEVGERGLAQVTQRLGQMLTSLLEEQNSLYRRREEQLVELVLTVSQQVICRELELQPQTIRNVVERGFQVLTERENLKVFLSPQDHEILAQASREGWPPGVALVPDSSLTPGGFRLEASLGELDGTLETRWERVAQAVREAMRSPDGRTPPNP